MWVPGIVCLPHTRAPPRATKPGCGSKHTVNRVLYNTRYLCVNTVSERSLIEQAIAVLYHVFTCLLALSGEVG